MKWGRKAVFNQTVTFLWVWLAPSCFLGFSAAEADQESPLAKRTPGTRVRARTPRDARLIHQSGNWMVWQTWDPIPTTGFISPIIQLKKQSVYLQRVGAKDAHVLMDFVADGGPRIYTVLEDGTVLLNWRDGPQWVKLGEEARVEKPILVDKKACWILNAWQDGMVIGPVRDSSDARLPMYWLPIANGVLDRAHIRRISDNTGWGQITTPHIARHKQQLAWARVDEPERWKRTHRLFIFSLETGELSQVQTPNLAHVIAFDDTYAYSGGSVYSVADGRRVSDRPRGVFAVRSNFIYGLRKVHGKHGKTGELVFRTFDMRQLNQEPQVLARAQKQPSYRPREGLPASFGLFGRRKPITTDKGIHYFAGASWQTIPWQRE